MRAAAGYRSSEEPGVPNLPGYSHAKHYMGMTQPRRSATLKYVNGYPIVEDKDVLPTPLPTAQSAYTRPQLEFGSYGGPSVPPLTHLPPSREQLEFQMIRDQQQKQRQQQESLVPSSTNRATYGSHARLGTSKGTMQWTGVKTPGWLLYDRKVLRFHAYSCDRVLYSPAEEVRVRYFDLFYHMEDGSLEMTEPQAENSGLIQGKYLNRHRAKLGTGQPLTHNELRVGQEIEMYGRRFMITGCDPATRAFYEEFGQPQPPNFSAPEDQHEAAKKAAKAADELRRSKRRDPEDNPFDEDIVGPGAVFKFEEDTKKKDQLDGKVLRFYACWDDTRSTFGQKLPFVIHYYLKDDTLEVAEHHRANTGRDPFPLLLRRCQLPKSPNVPPVGHLRHGQLHTHLHA
ncbi:hypothetical protein DUNSADRAFT_4997 [Dunaliella salina]|uniref:DM10 domain-containing protein n=1 Tax=Dunaliella salina TaxID=3046 RepID=A0ABQ7GQT7_DUNSA|nr:hypothetical protein DUNSADRAFT_4997 [Dunaliella salina]|eukprot:KAF5836975.1 hypothetical protein DUNSADRAFT_4997 [Dunaliella salina]